jgi:hypothetical protein
VLRRIRARAAWSLVACAACSADAPVVGDGHGSGSGDGGPLCLGTTITVCLDAEPKMPLSVTSATTIDTSNANNCTAVVAQQLGPELCVLAGSKIEISGALTATGTRPLVLFSSGDLTVTGSVDVSSNAGRIGAGGNDSSCIAGGGGQSSAAGAGGGAGGSFGTPGGNGGKGASGAVPGGGPAVASGIPSVVRGGCAGAVGGTGTSAADTPGAGGGAVYLLAGATLSIDGTINASGAGGGRGRLSKGGGSGGGSGGMIAFFAPDLSDLGLPVLRGHGLSGRTLEFHRAHVAQVRV